MSRALAFLAFDSLPALDLGGVARFGRELGFDPRECVDPIEKLLTPRRIFERRIRYWECRPMTEAVATVVSPADARVIPGSLRETPGVPVKEKLFSFRELLGAESPWLDEFRDGEFAVFRLTPDKYHYNHTPVAGRVADIYSVSGRLHSCNPILASRILDPYSKNERRVTIIDTDVDSGTRVGLVAMIEVLALMVGRIVPCYSENEYENPR
jgi:phosphatidylserine decarboxylase